jgi:hypothetical protein
MTSTVVTGSGYDDNFNTEPMHGISCYCICYILPLATNSWLVQTYCSLAFSCSGAKKQACVLEGNLNKVMLSKGNLEQTINCTPDAQTLNWG